MTPSVHIVIVNWNTGDYLRECLSSIVDASQTGVRVDRVTVVDNASSDDSAAGLAELPLPLELIRNGRNAGFAAACNQGAAGSTADYLVFLNPDTRLFANTLDEVARFMESDRAAGIGICGAQIVDEDGRPAISCARFPTLRVLSGKITGLDRLLPRHFPSHHLPPAETAESRLVDQVIGAFFFVRREVFTQLGGFDTRYYLYFEEVDFALRARQIGVSTYFLKEATVMHAENVSSNQVRDLRLYHSLRSRRIYARKHWAGWETAVLMSATLTVELAARLATAAMRRSAAAVFATCSSSLRFVSDVVRS
jgi:N-acetylglucosaminyl-diphospho-decaprenol L-rhamnosyltransferase